MNKIKETITALTAREYLGAVRINRKEHEPVTSEHLALILKCITKVTTIAAGTVLALSVETGKLVVILFFGILFNLFYCGLKD